MQCISAMQVAECCTEALVQEAAEGAVVEVISEKEAPELTWESLFEGAQR